MKLAAVFLARKLATLALFVALAASSGCAHWFPVDPRCQGDPTKISCSCMDPRTPSCGEVPNDWGDNPSQMTKKPEPLVTQPLPHREGLRYYLAGRGPRLRMGAAPGSAADVAVSPSWWVGPSIGIDVFTWDTKTHQYALGLIPGVGYGIKYAPAGWTLTPSVLALDVFVQASLVDQTATVTGGKWFTIQALPILTVLDWVSVGFGPTEYISVDSAPSALHWTFSFGVRKSL